MVSWISLHARYRTNKFPLDQKGAITSVTHIPWYAPIFCCFPKYNTVNIGNSSFKYHVAWKCRKDILTGSTHLLRMFKLINYMSVYRTTETKVIPAHRTSNLTQSRNSLPNILNMLSTCHITPESISSKSLLNVSINWAIILSQTAW